MIYSSINNFKIIHSTFEDRFISAVSSTEDVLIEYPMKYIIKKHQVNTFDRGIPYYDIPIKYSESDIISNIKVSYENNDIMYHKMKLVVNGNIQEIPREIYICALLFTKIELRVYFSDIIYIPETFTIEYNGYILSNIEDRRYFQRNIFKTDSHIYDNGIFHKLHENGEQSLIN